LKTIVITGAASGLGKELSILFSKENNVVVSDINEEKLNQLAQEINATPFIANVTKEEDVKNLRNKTVEKFGKIDIWINNAGIWFPDCYFEERENQKIKNIFEINVYGVIYGSKYAAEQMKKQKYGHIINIASTNAFEPRPKIAVYCASKFAVSGFTKAICLELKEFGINVSAIYPDGMKTEIYGENKPSNFDELLEPKEIAQKIFELTKLENPPEELIIQIDQ